MTKTDSKWHELLRRARDLRTFQRALIDGKKEKDTYARMAPTGGAETLSEDSKIEAVATRVTACLEDVEESKAAAFEMGAGPELIELASQWTQECHRSWLYEPLVAAQRNAAKADVRTRVQKLHETVQQELPRIFEAAAAAARGDATLRACLVGLLVEDLIAAKSGGGVKRRAGTSEGLLEHLPALTKAYPEHLAGLEVLIGAVALGKPQLRARLHAAGVRAALAAHARWLLGDQHSQFTLYVTRAILDAFVELEEVQRDQDLLGRVCEDIIREECKRAKNPRWLQEDEARSSAGKLLAELRERATWEHLAEFRAYLRTSIFYELQREIKARKALSAKQRPTDDIVLPTRPAEPDLPAQSGLFRVLDEIINAFWPKNGRAKERRKVAVVTVAWLHDWLSGTEEDLSERLLRELGDKDSKDPQRRLSRIRGRMRDDIEEHIEQACMRAGCIEIAETLVSVVVNLLAAVTDRDATRSFPNVLPQLRAAQQTLKTAHRTPLWLCLLVDWLILFLEGNT